MLFSSKRCHRLAGGQLTVETKSGPKQGKIPSFGLISCILNVTGLAGSQKARIRPIKPMRKVCSGQGISGLCLFCPSESA